MNNVNLRVSCDALCIETSLIIDLVMSKEARGSNLPNMVDSKMFKGPISLSLELGDQTYIT